MSNHHIDIVEEYDSSFIVALVRHYYTDKNVRIRLHENNGTIKQYGYHDSHFKVLYASPDLDSHAQYDGAGDIIKEKVCYG